MFLDIIDVPIYGIQFLTKENVGHMVLKDLYININGGLGETSFEAYLATLLFY